MDISTEVSLAGITLENPVMAANDTFGAGEECSEFVDLNKLGAIVTKDVAAVPWAGNPTSRLVKTPGGMLNTIDLQDPGVDIFLGRDLPFLKRFDTHVIVNVYGHSEEGYVEVVERFRGTPIDFLELDISCSNAKEGGITFGTQAKAIKHITRHVKGRATQPLIVRLSPNVMDIIETARTAEAGGANVLSLINTLTGMKIDIMRYSFMLADRTDGPSGPTVHPIAVHMTYDCAHAVKLPLIDTGDISIAVDAIEVILAGTTAVSVGTANFYDPCASEEVAARIAAYLEQTGTGDTRGLIDTVC